VVEDFERCYGAVLARDARFDGWFVTAVASTGVYCRPSCPARTPLRRNVRFLPGPAAAQQAGFRACKRCRPDAAPGSPQWNTRQDVVARAVRLIGEGVVDRDGVGGLARGLGYSTRHLQRLVAAELGAGPLALARAQRAQTARMLLETTELPAATVAFAAGFRSVRQFNDTVRRVFACTPGALRRHDGAAAGVGADVVRLRLPLRPPFAADEVVAFLAARALPGVEAGGGRHFARTLSLPHGAGVAELVPEAGFVRATLQLDDLRDLTPAVQRCRRLLDLDADPEAVDARLGEDPVLGPLVRRRPGLRLPGCVDPHELAVRAVLGQQVSVQAARGLLGRLVAEHGTALAVPRATPSGPLTHRFPDAPTLAALDPGRLPLPRARARAVVALASALAASSVVLDGGTDAEAARHALRTLPGVGPWTADYVAMRGLGHPDVALPADLGIRRSLAGLGLDPDAAGVEALARAWRPWRSYAMVHLWRLPPAAARAS